MPASRDLLIRTLRTPDIVTQFSIGSWDLLVRQARAVDLLAHLAHCFRQHGLNEAVPAVACWHFDAAETLADQQHIALRRELLQLRDALADLDSPLVVLKGTACETASYSNALERRFNTIEILVPHQRQAKAESMLLRARWRLPSVSKYDQHYRHRWMHQMSPMLHPRHTAVVNILHAIPSDSAREPIDAARLRHHAIAVANFPGIHVLVTADRIVHSATHLLHAVEHSHGLHDLIDLDQLVRDAAAEPDFWPRLTARADELRLSRSLFYALRYLRHVLDTPIPDSVFSELRAAAPNRATLALMDGLFTRVLAPVHASCADAFTPAARLATSLRAHWLRMPAHRLIPHALHHVFFRNRPDHKAPKVA